MIQMLSIFLDSTAYQPRPCSEIADLNIRAALGCPEAGAAEKRPEKKTTSFACGNLCREQSESWKIIDLVGYNCLFLNGQLVGLEDKISQFSIPIENIADSLMLNECNENAGPEIAAVSECLAVYSDQ